MINDRLLFKNVSVTKRVYIYPFIFLVTILIGGSALIISRGNGGVSADTIVSFNTPSDSIPRFDQNATISSVKSGSWSDPASWDKARVPTNTDVVRIDANNTLTINDTSAVANVIGITKDGKLEFNPGVNTKLTVVTILEYEGGSLEIGTKGNPISANVKAEIVIADKPIDTANDPRSYGNGIIALGNVAMYGDVRAEAYIQLAQEAKAKSVTLSLSAAPTGWKVGDKVILPDTRQQRFLSPNVYKPQYEEATIASFSSDRKTITLTAPLVFDHLGAYDGDKKLVQDMLPHIGDVTRNIVIHSANPLGTRGHTFFTQSANVDIHYAQFADLGRTTKNTINSTTFNPDGSVNRIGTNQLGRYAVHFHHVYGDTTGRGPGIANIQFQFIGNSVTDGTKWGVAVHNSHFGKVNNNVVYKMDGSGITTEDASEKANEFDHNFVMAINGNGQAPDSTGPNTAATPNAGIAGDCFWLHSANNKVTNNVMANCKGSGILFWSAAYQVSVPKYAGAKTHIAAEAEPFTKLTHFDMSNNTTYGAGSRGMWLVDFDHMAGNTIRNSRLEINGTKAWNITDVGVSSGGFSDNSIWRNTKVINDPNQIKAIDVNKGGLVGGGGFSTCADATWDNLIDFEFQNCDVGIKQEHATFALEYHQRFAKNGYLRNSVNLVLDLQDHYRASNTNETVIDNVKFVAPLNMSLVSIYWPLFNTVPAGNMMTPRRVRLNNYQQIAGNDFKVYHGQQSPEAIVPAITEFGLTPEQLKAPEFTTTIIPEAGLTNTQSWAKYGKALFGEVASCTDESPEIKGGSLPPAFVSLKPPSIINKAYICPVKDRKFTGTVTDNTGTGVAGAKVSLYTYQNEYNSYIAMSNINKDAYPPGGQHPVMNHLGESFSDKPFHADVEVTTDANGRYTLPFRTTLGQNVQLTTTKSGYEPLLKLVTNVREDQTFDFQIVPGGGDGLKAQYYSDQTFTTQIGSQIDKEVNIDWKTRDVIPGVKAKADAFSAKWAGEVKALVTGDYSFNVSPGIAAGFAQTNFARSEIIITVDGKQYTQLGQIARGRVHLEAGKRYPIKVNYVGSRDLVAEHPDGLVTSLVWATKDMYQQPIPQAQLYSSNAIVDKPGTTTLCVDLALGITNTPDSARSKIAIRILDQAGNEVIKAASTASSNAGRISLTVPAGVTISDNTAYTIDILVPGFLHRKVTGVTNLATKCYALTEKQKLQPGGFNNGGAKVNIQDLILAINAFNKPNDPKSKIVIDAYKRNLSVLDLVRMIKIFNDPVLSTGDN